MFYREPVEPWVIVSDVERLSTTRSATVERAAASGGTKAITRVGVLVVSVLALVSGATLPVVLPSRPAGADQVSGLQQQAAQISQELIKQQLEMGGLQQRYGAATQEVQSLGISITSNQVAVQADQRKIRRDFARLRNTALFAYMVSGTAAASSTSQAFSPNEKTAQAQREYQQLVAGNATVTLDQLHADQAYLRRQEQALHAEQAQAQAARQQAAVLVQQSQQVEQQLWSEESQVKGQLAVAVAQQRAAEAAAAQAAIRAAQQAAGAQAAAAQRAQVQQTAQPAPIQPVRATMATSSSGSGPALNSFLQCVIQAESGGNYGIVSANGQYFGAFQFSQAAWNYAAQLAGMPQLIGVQPNTATPAEQNALAIALYSADGSSPWYDPCTGY